jgi:hypothetical protein
MSQRCVCGSCEEPFVVPVDLLDIVDEGLFLLVLWCASCDALSIDQVEDAELELLDRHLDRTSAQIARAAAELAAGADVLL